MRTQIIVQKQQLLKILGFFGLCMLLSLFANPIFAQQDGRTVSGVVSNVDGPLESATVILKGSLEYVITDQDGRFVFPSPLRENDVLQISALGLEDAEVVIGPSTDFVRTVLADDPVIIIAALRTSPAKKVDDPN